MPPEDPTEIPNGLEYAQTDEEARERAIAHEHRDPLTSIPCGLLSSAEIDDYVRNTGMIFPYDSSALKSASYEMYLGGASFIGMKMVKRSMSHRSQSDTLCDPTSKLYHIRTGRAPFPSAKLHCCPIQSPHYARASWLTIGNWPPRGSGFSWKTVSPPP